MSRSCFWDCYGERVRQLLAKFFLFFFFSFLFFSFFFKSKLTVPEVNSTQFPVANCLLSSAKETSKFTQQEGTKKRTAKRLCMTNVTGLLLASFVVIFTYHSYVLVFYKKVCLKKDEVWRKVISNKIIVTLVTQGLPSSFLSSPVAQVHY